MSAHVSNTVGRYVRDAMNRAHRTIEGHRWWASNQEAMALVACPSFCLRHRVEPRGTSRRRPTRIGDVRPVRLTQAKATTAARAQQRPRVSVPTDIRVSGVPG